MAAEFDSFPHFGELAKELRLQIWEIAFSQLPKGRLIRQWNPLAPPTAAASLIEPSPPVDDRLPLLHACSESRSVGLPKLISAFGIPKQGYAFVDSHTKDSLSSFLREQGFPTQFHIPRMLESALAYYNAHPEKAREHPDVFVLSQPFPRLEPPMWFDFENDFLLYNATHLESRDERLPCWARCGTLMAGRVRRFAIEVSNGAWDWNMNARQMIIPRLWSDSLETGQPDLAALGSVEEVCMWTQDGCEIFRFTVDEKNLVPLGKWSFWLDTDAEDDVFKERFKSGRPQEQRWRDVTWRITFGRDETKNLCELMKAWRPHSGGFWRNRIVAARGVEGLGPRWAKHIESEGWDERWRPFFKLLENGDGRTYLGPSFDRDRYASAA